VTTEWTDRRVEYVIGNLLRAGVLISALIVLSGAAIYLTHHRNDSADYRVFHGEPTDLRHIRGILKDSVSLHGRGIIQLGLLLLIATPIARVAFSIFGFAQEKDWMYVGFTIIVLMILLYSLGWSS
jgi:uncharacterized membrane protein